MRSGVTPGQRACYGRRVTVRRMKENAAQPLERACGERLDAPRGEDLVLPARVPRDLPVVGRIRLADDPEMLELILAALLRMQ
jgi:hypothetical protein